MIITCIFIAMALLGLILVKSNIGDDAELSGLIISILGKGVETHTAGDVDDHDHVGLGDLCFRVDF